MTFRKVFIVSVCVCGISGPVAGEVRAAPGTLRAGVARSDITTEVEGVRINDPLYAKALVLDDGTTTLAIIAMDVTAIGGIGEIDDDFLPTLRGRIERELHIPGRHVLVNASHNHPPGRILCDKTAQVERTFDAVRRARENMTAVRVGAGSGCETRISMNRTLRLKNGKAWTIRHTNPSPPDEEVAAVGPIDPEIGILRIDRTDGRTLAVVYNFACHPYLGVPQGGITADYPGFASRVIEEQLGGGALALFLQGAGGDVTQVLYKDVNRPRDAEPQGTLLGLSTLKALSTIKTGDAGLDVITETVRLPRRTDSYERIQELEAEQQTLLKSLRGTSLNIKTFLPLYLKHALHPEHPSYYSYRYLQAEETGSDELTAIDAQNRRDIRKYLDNIYTMEKLARIQDKIATFKRHQAINMKAGDPRITTEVQAMKIGDFVMITSPAEVLVEVGLNVKQASPYEHTYMAAYSNGYIHYGPPASEYSKGGYEVTECLLAPEWQLMYEEKANDILRRLK